MRTLTLLQALAAALPLAAPAAAQCSNPASGPDVIVGDLPSISRFGTVGGITAYSIATTSCNVGNQPLSWIAGSNEHPVIAQNLYRVEQGRIEQVGMSWLKHGFTALQMNLCCSCDAFPNGTFLGVGCSDPYSASLNANQPGLGPRYQVNAFTGDFAYPFAFQGQSGNQIYKRLQVANDDIDPALHPDAQFFGEGHYVASDDAAAGHQANNASYRRVLVGAFSGGGYNLVFSGPTRREDPGIFAWKEVHPLVQLESVAAPGDGAFWVGSHVFEIAPGQWRYEYAVQNLYSDRNARSFSIPFPAGSVITDTFFRDVDYHSGEPWSGTDWSIDLAADSITWSTDTFAADPNANALRWGTLYSFGFTADSGPLQGAATLGLFKPGTGDSLAPAVQVPGDDCIPGVSSYCTAAPNSAHATGARMGSLGSTSIAANDFQLVVVDAVPNQFGLFYYGPQAASIPFGDGVRCVAAGALGTFRLNPVTAIDFFGQMIRPVDLTDPPSPPGTITEGTTWYFQFWYRDPQGGPAGFNLSDGLEVTFCP